jgi:putative cell wall-binding protein
MNKEQQELLDEAYENYLNNFIKPICPPNLDVQPDYYKPMTKEWFIKSTKENNSRGQEFSEKCGLKIEERELGLEERYHIWFTNNYETGMERYFDPNNIPKFDDPYYEPTPNKLITITYNDKTIESYE